MISKQNRKKILDLLVYYPADENSSFVETSIGAQPIFSKNLPFFSTTNSRKKQSKKKRNVKNWAVSCHKSITRTTCHHFSRFGMGGKLSEFKGAWQFWRQLWLWGKWREDEIKMKKKKEKEKKRWDNKYKAEWNGRVSYQMEHILGLDFLKLRNLAQKRMDLAHSGNIHRRKVAKTHSVAQRQVHCQKRRVLRIFTFICRISGTNRDARGEENQLCLLRTLPLTLLYNYILQ